MIIPSFTSKRTKLNALILNNQVTIKIIGTEEQQILFYSETEEHTEAPSQLYVNGQDNNPLPGDIKVTDLTSEPTIITMVWDSPLITCKSMFRGLTNIIEIDFSSFDASQVTDFSGMFFGCNNLASIDFRNLNTESLNNMEYMFYQCNSLISLDLTSFDTSKVTSMFQTFFECTGLETLDISSFNTSSVTSMFQTFLGCFTLRSLDLRNFDTRQVTTMFQMFLNCYDLEILDISSFNTENVDNMFNMFYCCNSLRSLDLSHFNTSSVTTMSQMFWECNDLEYLDISNFDTSKLEEMNEMFKDCNSLVSLDLSSFDTSSVTSMSNMFQGCSNIQSLDLHSFNTANVRNLNNMFDGCEVLESLDISNFDTSSALDISNMFLDCQSLKNLDLTNFDTSKVTTMEGMFHNCYSLSSLELGNFDTSSVTNMASMFYGCRSLISLNLNKFNTINVTSYDDMFFNVNNLKYCINDEIIEEIKSQLSSFSQNECLELCTYGQMKMISEKNKCINNCYDDDTYKFEYENICYSSCDNYYNYEYTACLDSIPLGYYLNNTVKKTIDKCNIKCSDCNANSELSNLCISCNNAEGYYPKYNEILDDNNFVNCYNEAATGYYLDTDEKKYKSCYSTCTTCTGKGTEENHKCSTCISNHTLVDGNCYNLENKMISDGFNETLYSYDMNKNMEELKELYKNVTFINFPEEKLNFLYQKFNLDREKNKIHVVMRDYTSNDERTATSDYTYRFFLENNTELNLSLLNEDIYVDFYVPIKNLELANFNHSKYFSEQGFDIYDKKSDFYNDFCTSAHQGENDMTLKDRKKDIYPNNVTMCKENCDYNGVDKENERVICSCNLKENNENKATEEDNFLAEDDGNFFSYLLDNINYRIFQCYDLLSSFSNLKDNYAFYTILGIALVIIVLNLVFCFYSLPAFKSSLLNEIPTKKSLKRDLLDEIKRIRQTSQGNLNNPKKKRAKTTLNENEIEQTLSIDMNNKSKKKKNKKMTKITNKKISSPSVDKFILQPPTENVSEDNKERDKIPKNKEENINELPYTQAVEKDKRNIFQLFLAILSEKLEIFNIFCGEKKLKVMLLSEFILSFLVNFFFNTLLYSDEVVSNKYHNNGNLDLIVTIVLSLLSNVITSIVCYYINYSKGIDERWELITELKIKKYFIKNAEIFFKYLKIKFIVFIIIEIVLIALCYYYIVIFNIVYSRSRGSLIINYLTSLLEAFITSIGITVIILVTRKIGLACLNKHIYNASKYINNKF